MEIKIMDNGLYEYDYMDKPVKYTTEFLQSLTGDYDCDVCDEHDGVKIGSVSSIFMKDGNLFADIEDELLEKGKGWSTVIYPTETYEYDEYYVPVSASLRSVDRVKNPKDTLTMMYNSKDMDIVDKKTKDNKENLVMENEEKNQKIGALKQRLDDKTKLEESLKDKISELEAQLKTKDEAISGLNETIESNDKSVKAELDKANKTIKAYKQKEESEKMEFAKSIAENMISEDIEDRDSKIEGLAKEYLNLSKESLEIMANKSIKQNTVQDTAYKGVPSNSKPPVPEVHNTADTFGYETTHDEFLNICQEERLKL